MVTMCVDGWDSVFGTLLSRWLLPDLNLSVVHSRKQASTMSLPYLPEQ
jgi:hypothetical protein